ncbi:MAG: nitrous oxide reductase accessory protein NosL [Planctomycetes bacterium]|nr:nitrous oxide reductase accessory protein NosL [Planctomycetota bacterium]
MTLSARLLPTLLFSAVGTVVLGAIAWSVFASSGLPTGPVELVFDKAACASCGMHVGEPRFAAQVITTDGRCHAFDDVGCLFEFLRRDPRPVHAAYVRHLHEARWLALAEAGFVDVRPSPMGFDLGAVDAGTSGAIDAATARRRCEQRLGAEAPR